jgi:hypothetical protein
MGFDVPDVTDASHERLQVLAHRCVNDVAALRVYVELLRRDLKAQRDVAGEVAHDVERLQQMTEDSLRDVTQLVEDLRRTLGGR